MTTQATALHPRVAQALAFTQAYKQHKDDHPALREAACLAVQFPALMGPIEPDDLFAGGWDGGWQGGRICYVGTIWWAMMDHRRGPGKQGGYCFDFDAENKWGHTEADRRTIQELAAFWEKEFTTGKCAAAHPPELEKYAHSDGQLAGGYGCGFCVALDVDRLLQLGLPGLREKVQQGRDTAQPCQAEFYQGLLQALDVVTDVCRHYEHQARTLADQARGSDDRSRLERIASSLAAIVQRPPAGLHEAMQLLWIYSLLTSGKHIECWRIDQALGDFFAADIDSGALSEEQATEMILGLWRAWSKHGDPAVCRVVIGGKGRRNPEKADRFCLAAMEATGRHQQRIPQLTLRFHHQQDPALMNKAFDVIGQGCVFPMLYNDDVIIPGIMRALNVPHEEAWAYHPLGCGEYMLAGKSPSLLNFGWSVPKSLEAAIHGGVDSKGKHLGPRCSPVVDGDPIEKLQDNLESQIQALTDLAARCHKINVQVTGNECAFLLASLLNDDCLQRGKSMLDGGVRYIGGCIMGHGYTNAADALHAIRTLVFEQKQATLAQILQATEADFQGYEDLLRKLKAVPKFGNDDPDADAELVNLWKMMSEKTAQAARNHGLDFLTISSVNPGGYHMGALCGATADGRRAGKPFAIGNAPTAGNDTSGLTALLNSLAKTDPANGGSASNIKLAKSLFDRNRPKLDTLFDVYWKQGGIQASVSVVDQEQLVDAMEHPEKYPHLLVRLGGWTARFVQLEKEQQEEVIRRCIY